MILIQNDYPHAFKRIFNYMFLVVFNMLLRYFKALVFIELIYDVDITHVFTFKSTKHTSIDNIHIKHIKYMLSHSHFSQAVSISSQTIASSLVQAMSGFAQRINKVEEVKDEPVEMQTSEDDGMEIVNEDVERVSQLQERILEIKDHLGVNYNTSIPEIRVLVDTDTDTQSWAFKAKLMIELLKTMAERSSARGFYVHKKLLYKKIETQSMFSEEAINMCFAVQDKKIEDVVEKEGTIDLTFLKNKELKDITLFTVLMNMFKSPTKNINEWEEKEFVNQLVGIKQFPIIFEDATLSKGYVVYVFNELEFLEFRDNGFNIEFRINHATGEKWVKLDFHFEILSSINFVVNYLRAKGFFKESSAMGHAYDIYVVAFKPRLEFNDLISEVQEQGASRYVSIADHYQFNALEVKSMIVLVFNSFGLKARREQWENSRPQQEFQMQRFFGGFFDVFNYGIDPYILHHILKFETHQAIKCVGSAAVVDMVVKKNLNGLLALQSRIERAEYGVDDKDPIDGIKIAIDHCKKLKELNIEINDEDMKFKIHKSHEGQDAGTASRASK